jgi:hypothetical protein
MIKEWNQVSCQQLNDEERGENEKKDEKEKEKQGRSAIFLSCEYDREGSQALQVSVGRIWQDGTKRLCRRKLR